MGRDEEEEEEEDQKEYKGVFFRIEREYRNAKREVGRERNAGKRLQQKLFYL